MGLQKRKKANTKEKIALLSEATSTWNYLDIMKYFGFSYGKANNLIRTVECEKGSIRYYEGKAKRRVKIDDVLAMFGTSQIKELEINLLKQNSREDKDERID